jgi:hypothetical protein
LGSLVGVSHLRLDESHGDAYTVWVSQGMPASPSTAEVAALQQAMDPSLLVPDRTVAVAADGTVGVDFDLPRFGVSLVTIQPAAGGIDGGPDTGGSAGISGGVSATGSGCDCRIGGGGNGADAWVSLLGMGILVVFVIARRCSAGREERNFYDKSGLPATTNH